MSFLGAASGWGLLYVVSSAGEVLGLRSLALIPLRLPAFTALLSNQLWIFLLPSYTLTVRRSVGQAHTLPLVTRLYQYSVCGLLTGIISICRKVSIIVLPGSVFALLISTSILFSVVLSRLVSGSRLNPWHYAAVGCCLGSACTIALTALLTNQEDVEGSNFPLGIPVALGAAFFVAIMGICQELYQKTWDGPMFNLYLIEMTLASSLVASACAVVFGGGVGELPTWAPALRLASSLSTPAFNTIIGVCAILPILKLAVRNSKYAVIRASSALFFEFFQASAALLSAIASVIAFNEPFGPGFIVAILLLALAFGLYSKAKIEARKLKAAAEGSGAAKLGGGESTEAAAVISPVALALGGAAATAAGAAAGVEAWGERNFVVPP